MDNSPSELPQEKTSVESSSPRPVLSQINYECSDDSPAAAKLSGVANAGYNVKNYAENKAAKVVDEKFSLTSVYSKPYLAKLDVKPFKSPFMLQPRLQLSTFYSEMGNVSAIYNQRRDQRAMAEAATVAFSGQEDEPQHVNVIEFEEKFEVYGSLPDSDRCINVELGVGYKDVCVVLYCARCSQSRQCYQYCSECEGPISLKYYTR